MDEFFTPLNPKNVKLIILETKNDKFKQSAVDALTHQLSETAQKYTTAKLQFNEAERYYESNKNRWKEAKAYNESRNARWDRDDRRKEMTR